jgi:hypothetical protein
METIETISDIAEKLGGTSAFGRVIGVKQSTASEMRRKNTLPVKYWPQLVDALKAIGVTFSYEELVKIHIAP